MTQAVATHDYVARTVEETTAQGACLLQVMEEAAPEAALKRLHYSAATLAILLHAMFLLLGFWLGSATTRAQRQTLPQFISVSLDHWPSGTQAEKQEALRPERPALLPKTNAESKNASASVRTHKESTSAGLSVERRGIAEEGTPVAQTATGGDSLSSPPTRVLPTNHGLEQGNVKSAGLPQDPLPEVLARPLYAVNPPPLYPPLARRLGKEGVVLLEVYVSASGAVDEVKVATGSGHELLDETALKTVRGWRFSPGLRNGQPAAMRVRVPVRFELHG